ncbi:hypothetical protein J2X06_001747 [Lysobacter niastensis]|uniref:Single-stranded DNA-binding protein n=1 Tax=Lysobacter niastensis TaxID=380629 RepID=A0ABU1WAD1_9GAMM|nr:ERF family protein [Lysobacter niastensis]MDR7134563.1 hypothetical protein [Lysobacter niastensis]
MTAASATPAVYAAIGSVMADLAQVGVGKDAINQHDAYRYRSIDAVLNALSPILARHHLIILPTVIAKETIERTSKSGGILMHITLTIRYRFVCSIDGSSYEIEVLGEASDRADKAINKAMAAAFKYACVQVFCIAYQGMADADSVTNEPVEDRAASAKRSGPEPTESRKSHPAMLQEGTRADALAADLADAIDDAATDTRLAELVPTLRTIPESMRAPLRRRFAEKLGALRKEARGTPGLDAAEQPMSLQMVGAGSRPGGR